MKKILPLVLIVVGMTTNAQTEKQKPPPPPPPKPKEEKIKPPPKIADEKVKYKVVEVTKPNKVDEKVIEPPVITVSGKMADEFYKRNPSVSEISRRENIITIKKKDGAIEKYDMSKKEEDKSFTEKYGVPPMPPPPPPPPKKIS